MTREERADDWFKLLKTHVHSVLNKRRKDRDRRVRIAILDTGVDATHPEIRAARDKEKLVSFISPSVLSQPDPFDPDADTHGHGTHVASVLMRTAPDAVVYVARVADQQGRVDYDHVVEVCTSSLFQSNLGAGNRLGDPTES
jgi:Subtilase family